VATAEAQPFKAHLIELRRRLFACVGAISLGVGLGYMYREPLINWLEKPLNAPLYYTSPMGSLQFLFQVCFMVGVIVALPVIVYNILGFMEPALPRRYRPLKRFMIVISSCLLATLGVGFAYVVVLPAALHFFAHLNIGSVQPLISTSEYFSFAAGLLATFAVLFQLPLIMLGINTIKPLPPKKLWKYQKYVIVLSFGVALVLPFAYDPVTQLFIALPLIALYELSMLLVWWANRPQDRRRAQVGEPAPQVAIEPPTAAAPAMTAVPPGSVIVTRRVDRGRPIQLG
jgi:sec-independent protein translocase protein TatC